jgi:hypothetical protein
MRRIVSTVFALATLASPLAAQTHTDFSGKWALDPKSVANTMGPASMTMTVKQDSKTLAVETAATSAQAGEMKSAVTFNLDGSESKNTVTGPMGALELLSTGKWEGPAFIVTTKADIQGTAMTQTEKWTLGEDAKTLTVERSATMMGQTQSLKLLFTKQ